MAVVIIYCMIHRSPKGVPSPTPKEVSEEVLWCGGLVNGSAGLGDPGTITPLAGAAPLARAKDVIATTCKTWALLGVSTTFCFFVELLGVSIVTHVLDLCSNRRRQ
ncbi:UNVERIFIED_CONTAM: hypothetical protein Sradi_3950000 [Sesamum radiatum]|uniref:Uncharacterized protein n=1 Tax=Sesamum radiatum TaxID=300843 RepID=A0AAW2PKD3_SESRA